MYIATKVGARDLETEGVIEVIQGTTLSMILQRMCRMLVMIGLVALFSSQYRNLRIVNKQESSTCKLMPQRLSATERIVMCCHPRIRDNLRS
jgi:hypothetical protein